MLVKLLPEQVAENWNTISPMIAGALPPTSEPHPRVMRMVLEAMMLGRVTGWLICKPDKGNGEMYILGFITTVFSRDAGSTERNLLIYSLYAVEPISSKVWRSGYNTLRKYAEKEGCKNIIGYTSNPKVVNLVETLGGDVSTTLIKLEV